MSWSFDIIHREFVKFGTIREIRNRLRTDYLSFESWVIFDLGRDALRASKNYSYSSSTTKVICSIVDEAPRSCDIYRPPDEDEVSEEDGETVRSPKPPRWQILTTSNERGNLFKVKRFINQKGKFDRGKLDY